MVCNGAAAQLYKEDIKTDMGFAVINIGNAEIVSKYDVILHAIHPFEISEILKKLNDSIPSSMTEEYKVMLWSEINMAASALTTLMPRRQKRGILNIGGTAMKWLYGTMDEEDREMIEEHLKIVEQNDHNLIQTLNQQIAINENFNNTFRQLKKIIESDRAQLQTRVNQLFQTTEKQFEENFFVTQMFKINMVQRQIRAIQQALAMAQSGFIQPNVLTEDEIIKFNIDFKRLQAVRVGVATFKQDVLVLAIKVPSEANVAQKRLIVPIPNKSGYQISSEIETVVEIGNKTCTFEEGKASFQLKESRNCVFLGKCGMIRNKKFNIQEIDNNQIIITNAVNKKLNSTCDVRELNLTGSYYIKFQNCTIQIDNVSFQNKFVNSEQTFIIPLNPQNLELEQDITFEEIVLNQKNNIEQIKELHYHKTASIAAGSLTILVIASVCVAVIILCRKQTRLKVKVSTERGGRQDTTLHSIIRRKFDEKKKVYAFFVDFKAAFDKIPRRYLFEKLRALGLSSKIIRLIENVYRHTKSAIWTGNKVSDFFETFSGVKQGCLLSPTLFTLYLEDLFETLGGGLMIGGENIRLLLYADDIVILSDDIDVMQGMINKLEAYCDRWKMEVNMDKSEMMVFRRGGRLSKKEKWYYKGEQVKLTSEYNYLGVILTPQMKFGRHVKARNLKAKNCLNATWKDFLNKKSIALKSKYNLFQSVCRSVQTYAAQVWGFCHFEEIDQLQRFFIKRILKLPDCTPNYALALETNVEANHFYSLTLHMEYVFKTIFKYDPERLPHKLSLLILAKNIFWAKHMNFLGAEFNIVFNAVNTPAREWLDKGTALLENLKLKSQRELEDRAKNSNLRFYKYLNYNKGIEYFTEENSLHQMSTILKLDVMCYP